MIISVASGKGGTGKTLVATSIVRSWKDKNKIQLLDRDVEEPNAHVFLKPTFTYSEAVAIPVPEVDEAKCTACLTCVRICPFGVPQIAPDVAGVGDIMGAAQIEAAVCQGCGTCVAECPAKAIQLMHYTDTQLIVEVETLINPQAGFVPLDQIEAVEGGDK